MAGGSMIDQAVFTRLEEIDGPSFVVKMIELFRQNLTTQLTKAREGLEQGNPVQIENAAHSIRSSAGNFSAMELAKLATEIENEASDWDQEMRKQRINELQELFNQVDQDLQTYLKEKPE